MPRQPRLEYEDAIYHVINRGNYRRDVFATDGAKEAFLTALDETASKFGWKVYAWVIMSNHFHVALETPNGDLVAGMKQWQGSFATRFNRLRTERGHIFQGRYKSQLVEGSDYLGALCHYIHLNPVRARLVPAEEVSHWPWSSLHWLEHPERRPSWFHPAPALQHAGGLADDREGHSRYYEYLGFLATDRHAQKELKFSDMGRGWVIGSAAFKQALIDERTELQANPQVAKFAMGKELEGIWEQELAEQLRQASIAETQLARTAKSAEWKVALAAAMRARTTVTNSWLAEHLHMGSMHEVSRQVSRWNRQRGSKSSGMI